MLILALESSAKAASAALARDGRLIAQKFENNGLTHSKTLLPMAQALLREQGTALSEVDAIAVSHGPGSFTGVRIGISTVKGLCWGAEKPAIGVSTLEAMAWNGAAAPEGSIICCAMDARRAQVYNALFCFENGAPRRMTEDRAISIAALEAELKALGRPVYLVGDGAALCEAQLDKEAIELTLAPEERRWQCAWGVCQAAAGKTPADAGTLLPVYLRLSQAERERLAKLQKE